MAADAPVRQDWHSSMDTNAPLLELRSISKQFPGVRALDDVSLIVGRGEILAVVGENGAGKSTLLKILGGILQPDGGAILIDQQPRDLRSPREANQLGIRLIHQELVLAEDLSVAENIVLGRYPTRGPSWLSMTDRRRMHEEADAILQRVGLRVSTHTIVNQLSVGQRQLVEIGKALAASARILILDEPTSSLSLDEANRLLTLLEQLRDQGTAIIYVSHRLAEVVRIADRVTVLRDGRHVGTLTGSDISPRNAIELMIGRELEQFFPKSHRDVGDAPLAVEVRELRATPAAPPLCFHIRRGEIVGFAGLVGAGRSELARMLFGVDPHVSGEVRVDGHAIQIRSPVDAVRAGLAFVPEERAICGLLLRLSTQSNISLVALPTLARGGWCDRGREFELATRSQQTFDIRTSNLAQAVGQLSGGNQQKVVLAKWLAVDPHILILDEPTRGIDVGAKAEIYRIIVQLAARGMAIMMISSEMEELIGVADRVLVMHEGCIAGELVDGEISEAAIMELAVGSRSFTGAA
jgi:ribose transport system ATP-binding protein